MERREVVRDWAEEWHNLTYLLTTSYVKNRVEKGEGGSKNTRLEAIAVSQARDEDGSDHLQVTVDMMRTAQFLDTFWGWSNRIPDGLDVELSERSRHWLQGLGGGEACFVLFLFFLRNE